MGLKDLITLAGSIGNCMQISIRTNSRFVAPRPCIILALSLFDLPACRLFWLKLLQPHIERLPHPIPVLDDKELTNITSGFDRPLEMNSE